MKITKTQLRKIIKEETQKEIQAAGEKWFEVYDEESGKTLEIWASTLDRAVAKSEDIDYGAYEDGDAVMSTKNPDTEHGFATGERVLEFMTAQLGVREEEVPDFLRWVADRLEGKQ